MKKASIGLIGLGGRGRDLLTNLAAMPDVDIPAVCELYQDRLESGIQLVETAGRPRADGYTSY